MIDDRLARCGEGLKDEQTEQMLMCAQRVTSRHSAFKVQTPASERRNWNITQDRLYHLDTFASKS
jgi:hypothetical protein